jgi:hypothetical protein
LATFLTGADFLAAFLTALFLTTFLAGFLGMSRTLCLCSHRYQLRHGPFLSSQSSTLRVSRKGR